MSRITLYNWEDKEKRRPLREVESISLSDMNRNGTRRVYFWSAGEDEPNYWLYPDNGTAYPEYEEKLQRQRIGKVFLYTEAL